MHGLATAEITDLNEKTTFEFSMMTVISETNLPTLMTRMVAYLGILDI